MLARKKEGISIAKAEGKYRGRKPIEVNKEKLQVWFDKFEWKKTNTD